MKEGRFQSDSGYSLLEVLVALVILLIVLIPAGHWLGKLLTDRIVADKLIAVQLAETKMEEMLVTGVYRSERIEVLHKNRKYSLRTTIHDFRENLILISIEVSRKQNVLTLLQRSQFRKSQSKMYSGEK